MTAREVVGVIVGLWFLAALEGFFCGILAQGPSPLPWYMYPAAGFMIVLASPFVAFLVACLVGDWYW